MSKITALFPALPADLTSLTRDELQVLADEHVETARRIGAGDEEFLADLEGAEVVRQMTDGVAALETIRAAIGVIDEAEAEYLASVSALAAQFGVADAVAEPETEVEVEALAAEDDSDDEDDPEETDEPDDEALAADVETPVAEPVLASAPKPLRRPEVPASHRPRITVTGEPRPAALVASGIFDRVAKPGQKVDKALLAALIAEAQRTTRPGMKTILASAQADYPSDRVLDGSKNDWEKVQAAIEQEAITASGGLCAPYTPLYDLPIVASAAEPVWNNLNKFQATRGGITFPTPLSLSDVTGGITVVTVAEDETPGSTTKNVIRIDCDAFQTAEIEAIAGIVEHGRLDYRAWPERVTAVASLMDAAMAQASESEMLRLMTAASTVRTQAAWYGAYSTVVKGILQAAAAMRSRHRMEPNTILDVYAPAWLPDMIAADLASNAFNRLDPGSTRSAIEAKLAAAAVSVTWYMDQDGTTTQVHGADGASALDEFLTEVAWYIHPRGTFIGLDQGRLDLGIVTDSDLNSTNDLQVFQEVFRGLAMVGVQALKVISTVCPDGTSAPAGTAETC